MNIRVEAFERSVRVTPVALGVGIAAVLVASYRTLADLAGTWIADASYQHGMFIPLICGWLVWRRRDALRTLPMQPSLIGLLLLALCGVLAVVASGAGVRVVEQWAVVAMIPAVILTIAGSATVRLLAFPLAFLFLMVPIGQSLVPWLMNMTTDAVVAGVRLSGIPVWRSGHFFSIPAGDFEVAKACSGIRYLIAAGTCGVLFAYVTFRSWKVRLGFVALSLVVPIIGNWLRAYLIVIIAHHSDMRYATGFDHIVYGALFFGVLVAVLFGIGTWLKRFDTGAVEVSAPPATSDAVPSVTRTVVATVAVVVVTAMSASYASYAEGRVLPGALASAVAPNLPSGQAGWDGPRTGGAVWHPDYRGSVASANGRYRNPRGQEVDVYVGTYRAHAAGGAEMIHHDNRIQAEGEERRTVEARQVVQLPGSRSVDVIESALTDGHGNLDRLAWHWYEIGSDHAVSPVRVKMLEALVYLRGESSTQRVVVLSTPADGDLKQAHLVLETFLAAHELRGGAP